MKRVFLSSTAKDLGRHRDAVYEVVSGMDGYECVRKEDFGARDFAAVDFCRARVKECDVFVGLIGHLYGSSPEGSETSFTEREYDAAVEGTVPRLLFVASDDLPFAPTLREPDERWQRQVKFRERVLRDGNTAFFTESDALATEVVKKLGNVGQGTDEKAEPDKSVVVFISYRRTDTAGYAHLIHRALRERLSSIQVFIDVESIEPGRDFVEVIEQSASSCSVCLVLMGQHWIANGRLEQPDDPVRLEVDTALRHRVRTIPLLVDDTPMPNPEELPESLRPLTRRRALEIRGSSLDNDLDRLTNVLAKISSEQLISRKA